MTSRRPLLARVAAVLPPLVAALAPAAAHAQAAEPTQEVFFYEQPTDRMAFDVQLFEPSPSPRSITTLDLAAVPSHLSLTFGLWTSYASNPWVVVDTRNGVPVADSRRPVVSSLFQTEVHASLGLFEYLELGLAMPVVMTTHAAFDPSNNTLDLGPNAESNQVSDFGAGDLRGFLKIPILRGALPLAIRVGASAPTGRRDAFMGNLAWTFTPAVVASRAFGPVVASANVGLRFRERNGLRGDPAFVLDEEITWGVGARYHVTERVGINAELLGRIGYTDGFPDASRLPVEAILGGHFQLTEGLSAQVGAGRGLSGGYGAPEFRLFAGARFTATRSQCAGGPEDYDGYQDGDYCADPDNDGDGIADADDRCPNDAEDRDMFLDTDGCFDPDNDSDGVQDDDDRCPMEPEDLDNFQDQDGCPEGDNDRDGVQDAQDACPREPEDPDSFEDQDGCPEPGPEAVVVTRTGSHLLLSQRVFFDYDSDTIRSVSLPILNAVAQTLRENPDITRVRVEGYTDGAGDPQYNLDLSYRRARAVVEYLVTRGVPRDHLEFQGYGSTHLVADDSTPEGQALNRRVEFTITGQANQQPAAQQGGAAQPGGRGRRRGRQPP